MEPIPARAVPSLNSCSVTDQQDILKNEQDAEPSQCLMGRRAELTGIQAASHHLALTLVPVFIVPSHCVMSNKGHKLPWDGASHF